MGAGAIVRSWVAAVGLAGCTASGQASKAAPEVGSSATPSVVPTARSVPELVLAEPTALGARVDALRLAGGRTLMTYCTPGPRPALSLALASGPAGHAWTYTAPAQLAVQQVCARRARAIVSRGTIVLPLGDHEYTGALGIDLARGATVWQTDVRPHRGPGTMLDAITAQAGDGYVLHVLAERGSGAARAFPPTAHELLVYTATTGALTGRVQLTALDWTIAMPGWIAHSTNSADSRGPPPAQPSFLRRADDLSIMRPLGELYGMCAVEDRLYTLSADGLNRVAPDLPGSQPLTPIWLGPETEIVGCDRRQGTDVIWLTGQVIGVTPEGDVLWHVDLEPWTALGRGGAELPGVVATEAWARQTGTRGLLVVDPSPQQDVRATAVEWPVRLVAVAHDARVNYLELSVHEPTKPATSLLAAVDGADGAVVAAAAIEQDTPLLRADSPVAGQLWLFAIGDRPIPAAGGSLWPDRRLRLDSAMLTPVLASPFVVRDALAQARSMLGRPVAFATLPPPSRPRPGPDRSPAPEPPWNTYALVAAARTLAAAPDSAPVGILAWDRQVEADDGWAEHALVVVEHVDRQNRPTWTVALMRRGNRRGEAIYVPDNIDDDFFTSATRVLPSDEVGVWDAFQRNDATPQVRRFWRRPSDADLQRLLASNQRWDFQGCLTTTFDDSPHDDEPHARATVVDGNVLEVAWVALTGEAPSRSYDPAIERPQ
jgi:hypothetical protein